MSRQRVFITLILLLGLWATPLHAQVAVPELAPGGIRIFDPRLIVKPLNGAIPANPAALQWDSPTRVLYGEIRGSRTQAGTPSTEFSGSYYGFRYVQDNVAVALQGTEFTKRDAIEDVIYNDSAYALSFRLPASLAWGVSSYSTTRSLSAVPAEYQEDGWMAGLSWRLGEIFYLGAAYGQEDVAIIGVITEKPSRSRTLVGIGLRSGGSFSWHLEIDRLHEGDVIDSLGVNQTSGTSTMLYVAEANWNGWLFGYSSHKVSDNTGGYEASGYVVDFGYGEQRGFTATWRYESGEVTPLNRTDRISSLALSWGF